MAGGLPSGVRVRAADGELYAQRGANWQHLASGIEVLAVPPAHWMLVGSLLVDLRRIHDSLAARAEE